MKTKSQMLFGGPTEAEKILLANQAAMMTALSAICDAARLGRYSEPLLVLANNTHEYLKRHRDKDNEKH